MKYIINEEQIKTRLDKFLVEKYLGFSRSQIKKFIESGKVKVGGKEVTAHYFLKLGEVVEAELGEPKRMLAEPNVDIIFVDRDHFSKNTECPAGHSVLSVPIIYEEDDFLIINKPAGLVVHQGEGHNEADTLANGLLAKYPKIAKIGDDPIRPGIVHRLDGEVSGVMVIAKTQDMYDHLKQQFKRHEVEKEYVAIVKGKVSPPHGVIDFPIDRKEGKMVARAKGQEGKMAVTEYEVIEHKNIKTLKHKNTTLLKIVTRTGRTHQIRVHLKAKGWPIAGDDLYKSKIKDKKSKTSGTERLMLHARKLSFKDLSGQIRIFVVEAPAEFGNF